MYYPVGNGIFNIDKSIGNIKWIIYMELKEKIKDEKVLFETENESNVIGFLCKYL